jgi:hypothetical protein
MCELVKVRLATEGDVIEAIEKITSLLKFRRLKECP